VSTYSCAIDIPKVSGLPDQQLTVGRVFYYKCEGDWSANIQIENLKVQFAPTEKGPELSAYSVRALGFELRDPQTAELKLVSYQPGDHQVGQITLLDGEKSIALPGFQLQVQSVLSEEQPAKPFGPMGPLSLSVPLVYWLILVSVLGLAIFSMALAYRKKKNRMECFNQIQKDATGPTPLIQFHRDLRVLTKKAGLGDVDHKIKVPAREFLDQLRNSCHLYWGQKLKVALYHRSLGYFESEMKKCAPKYYIKFKKELLYWDQRYRDLYRDHQKAQFEDFVKFTTTTRNLIDAMEDFEP
jgi:hypothetical protein